MAAARIGANVQTSVQVYLYDRDRNPHDRAELGRFLNNLRTYARSGGWSDVLTTTKPAHMPPDMDSTLVDRSATGGGTIVEQQEMRDKNTVAMEHLRASMVGAQNTSLLNESITDEYQEGQVWTVLASLEEAVTVPVERAHALVDAYIMQMDFDKNDDPNWWFNKIAAVEGKHGKEVMSADALLAKILMKLPETYRLHLADKTYATRAELQKALVSLYSLSVSQPVRAANEHRGGRRQTLRHQSQGNPDYMLTSSGPYHPGSAHDEHQQQPSHSNSEWQPQQGGWQGQPVHGRGQQWQGRPVQGYGQQPVQGGWQAHSVQGWNHGTGMAAMSQHQQQGQSGCSICGDPSHISRDCPQRFQAAQQANPPQQQQQQHYGNGRNGRHCTICNMAGHNNIQCWEDPRNAHLRPAGWQSRLSPEQHARLFPQAQQQQPVQPGGAAVPMVPKFPDIDIDYCMTAVGVSTEFDPATPADGGGVSLSECDDAADDGSKEFDDDDGDSWPSLQIGSEEEDEIETGIETKKNGAVSKRLSADMLQDPNLFICDTGATSHVTSHDFGFTPYRAATNADATLGFHGVPTKPKSIGTIQGHFLDKDGLFQQQDAFKMEEVKLQPDSKFNLFSASTLTRQGWTLGGDQHAFWLEHPDTKYRIMFDILVPANDNVLYCTHFQRSEVDSGQVGNQVEQVESVVAMVKEQETDWEIDKVEVLEHGVEEGTSVLSMADPVNNDGSESVDVETMVDPVPVNSDGGEAVDLKDHKEFQAEEGTIDRGQFIPCSLLDETIDETKKKMNKSATEFWEDTLVRLGGLGFSGCDHEVDKMGRYHKETKEGLVEFLSWVDDATCKQYEGVEEMVD